MKDAVYKISLDIHEHGSQTAIKAKNTDTGRKLFVSLRSGGTPYIIEDDCYAVFKATKPDGTILYNACTIENNEIIYEFTPQTCAAVGRCRCEIALYGLDDKLITSPRFMLLVDGTIYPDDVVESTDEFSALTALVGDTLKSINDATEAAKSANESAESANNAKSNANQAAESASQAATAATQAIQNANEATENANTATKNANEATSRANEATQAANNATSSVSQATERANEATNNATLAADNANKAATQAAHTAKSLMVVGEAKGEVIALDDAIDQFLVGCRIFGKTVQDGTPTPDAPVDLVSVGDSGSITVNVNGEHEAQSMSVATPNGLPGIPVTSGGNYTDANGQQWVCDEIDFARGVYIKRVKRVVLDGAESFSASWTLFNSCVAFNYPAADKLYTDDTTWATVICNILPGIKGHDYTHTDNVFGVGGLAYSITFKILKTDIGTVAKTNAEALEEWKSYLAEKHAAGMPVVFVYAIKPIETPLSEEELAAYASLHTYRDHTTVSNDASAHMEIEYVMDAKKYIDSLVNPSGIIPATVE